MDLNFDFVNPGCIRCCVLGSGQREIRRSPSTTRRHPTQKLFGSDEYLFKGLFKEPSANGRMVQRSYGQRI